MSEALAQHFGRPVPLELVADDGGAAPAPEAASGPGEPTPVAGADSADVEAVDLDELTDAPDASTGTLAQLQDAFPGAELVEEQ